MFGKQEEPVLPQTEQEKTEQAKPEIKEPEKATPSEEKTEGVKVTKGGISKFVDPSQVATYKANGWT
jgi:hypothetical protein